MPGWGRRRIRSDEPGRPLTLRVLSIPAAHPYVAAVTGAGVRVLPDPPVAGAPAGQWWPPAALQPGWVTANAAAFDLAHVHFGTESRTVPELEAFVAELVEAGRPLVYTVHDLDHPHLIDAAGHQAELACLARGADALLTLTAGAAAELRRRLGLAATVIPHPSLASPAWFARADAIRDARPARGPQVGIHLRSLRANVRPGDWIAALAEAVEEAGGRLHVFVNDDAGRHDHAARAAWAELRGLLASSSTQIHTRPRPEDDGLAHELAALDVAVLPYAHGTHSGWLELCWDLGTRVLMPRVGYFAEQHSEPWFGESFDAGAPAGLGAALRALLAAPPVPAAAHRLAERGAQTQAIRAAHLDAYTRALGAVTRGPSPIAAAHAR